MKDSKGSIRDALQAIRESQSEVVLERINFHGKSPAERKGSEFNRKQEINGYKKILKAIEKINKDHEKFQYNNRADGPSKIFKGLQQVESACYDLIREIEQGKWDGTVDLEEAFTLPDYPMQKDQPRYMDGEWVTGDAGKAYTFDHDKTGEENVDDMNDQVKADRAKEQPNVDNPGNTGLKIS
jgi:hypothetical protein